MGVGPGGGCGKGGAGRPKSAGDLPLNTRAPRNIIANPFII